MYPNLRNIAIPLIIVFSGIFYVYATADIIRIDKLETWTHLTPQGLSNFIDMNTVIESGGKFGAEISLEALNSTTKEIKIKELLFYNFLSRNENFTVKSGLWTGNYRDLGSGGEYQGFEYHCSPELYYKGWHSLIGNGIFLSFGLFSQKLWISPLAYIDKRNAFPVFDLLVDLDLSEDTKFEIDVGYRNDMNLRAGFKYITKFSGVRIFATLGIPYIPLSLNIDPDNIYMLVEENIKYFFTPDQAFGIDQTISIFLRPEEYNFNPEPYKSDVSTKLKVDFVVFRNFLVGLEGIVDVFIKHEGELMNTLIDVGPRIGVVGFGVKILSAVYFRVLEISPNPYPYTFYHIKMGAELTF